jgi:GntP family gluconate:H+ symporter
MPVLAAAATASSNPQLITAAVLGIATVVVLITWAKLHPFLALIIGSGVLGVVAGLSIDHTITSFTNGVGSTVGSVGLLIALGAMIGGLLNESGGADRIVDTVVSRVSSRRLPWAMAGLAALIGLPLFFEVGVVLLVPVVLLVSRRTDVPLLKVGIPALAGLSVLHGLVPPHPGPLVAISSLKADLGLTLAFGLICAIPTVIIGGPIFASVISRFVDVSPPAVMAPTRERVAVGAGGSGDYPGDGGDDGRQRREAPGSGTSASAATQGSVATAPPRAASRQPDGAAGGDAGRRDAGRRDGGRRAPAFWPAVITILLPIVLMLARAIGELTLPSSSTTRKTLDVIGTPVVALLAGVILAMFTLGFRAGFSRSQVSAALGNSLGPIAGILLIVAAGGGFKQVLVDAGVGNMIANAAKGASISPLLLGWLVAVGIRVATGSATVATITAAGIVAPLAAGLTPSQVALLALAVGCGSLFFSHVNDAGFWLVKEYFGMTVGQTIKTWSLMETILSVVGFGCVLVLYAVV